MHRLPSPGQIVRVRARTYLVEHSASDPPDSEFGLVGLACIDDDAQGEKLEVIWDLELDTETRLLSDKRSIGGVFVATRPCFVRQSKASADAWLHVV